MQRQETTGKKEITVLDAKRSNAINIGLTVLPPPRTIKAAILKMDNAIMNREGIEVTTDSFSCSVFVNRSFTEKLHLYARLLALNFYFNDYLIKDLIYSEFFFSPENFDWHDSHSRGENKHSGGPDGKPRYSPWNC